MLSESFERKIRKSEPSEKNYSEKMSQDTFSSGKYNFRKSKLSSLSSLQCASLYYYAKMCFVGVVEQSTPSPPNSGGSSPYSRLADSPTPPTLSPQANHNGGSQSTCSTDYKYNLSDDFDGDDQFDPSIPDASTWSYDEVYNYFAQYFPEEAIVFKEQVSLHVIFLTLEILNLS